MITRRPRSDQLSQEASAEIIQALEAWKEAQALTDYDLAAILSVNRDTIGRWRRHPRGFMAKTVARLIAGVEEHVETANAARAELCRLLTAAEDALAAVEAAEIDPGEQLRRRLNARRLRGATVLAEIEAAGFHVVAKGEEGREQ